MSRWMSKNVREIPVPASRSFSEYIANPTLQGGGTFVMRRIPIAPDAAIKRGFDWEKGEHWEEVTISCACPHCLEDVKFRYETEAASEGFVQAMERSVDDAHRRSLDAVIEAGKRVAAAETQGRPQAIVAMQMDAMDEWYA